MANLSREYCAYFGEATEVWKRYVIGEIIVAFDEYRDSVCWTLQDADNSSPNASAGGVRDINNQEEMIGGVLENAQQQAQQRIVNALNQTLNQPPPPPVLHSPVVSNIENQTAHVNPPGESSISQGGLNSGQNDDNSLDVSIKSEVDSSSESECESDTDDDDVQVKEEPTEEDEDITARSEEQTENANNSDDNCEIGHVDAEDDDGGDFEEDKSFYNMEIDESDLYDRQESDYEGSMIDGESDHFEDQVNMSGAEENDDEGNEEEEDYIMNGEESSDETTDDDAEEEQTTGPSTSNRQVSKHPIVPNRQLKPPIKVKKTESLSVITKKYKCPVPGCKKVVKNKKALNRHLLSAHKLKKYRCLVRRCYGRVSTSFTTKAQFEDHLEQVHGSSTRWTCHCSKKFNSHTELNVHFRNYHELGQFACSKDGCTFKPTITRIKVLHHQGNHPNAKYECPVGGCSKSFKLLDHLNRHLFTHSGERPFDCPECDKSFNRKGHLIRHLQIHRNDKCYRCTWPRCNHSATQRGNVITHIRLIHFKLPRTKRQQAEEGIEDDRDPRDYLARD